MRGQRGCGELHALLHGGVDTAGVGLVVAQRQKQGKGMLQKRAGMAQHGVAQLAQLGDQSARRNDIAQAQ